MIFFKFLGYIVVESDLSFRVLDFSVRMEQGTVTSLVEENGVIKGVQYKTKQGQELQAFAPLTIVCDGCFSNLRRSLCKPKVCDNGYCVKLVTSTGCLIRVPVSVSIRVFFVFHE